jgi:acyl carrier protein
MTSSMNELLGLIQKAYDIDPSTIDPNQPLSEFGLDSLALAELMFNIEDHFGIDYPESRANVQTLAELVQVVDEVRGSVSSK